MYLVLYKHSCPLRASAWLLYDFLHPRKGNLCRVILFRVFAWYVSSPTAHTIEHIFPRNIYRPLLYRRVSVLVRHVFPASRFTIVQLQRRSRGKGFPATVFGNLVKVFTVVLYAISTIHLALAMKQNYEAFAVDENADEVFADQPGDIVIAHLAMELVNVRVLHVVLVCMIPLTDITVYHRGYDTHLAGMGALESGLENCHLAMCLVSGKFRCVLSPPPYSSFLTLVL